MKQMLVLVSFLLLVGCSDIKIETEANNNDKIEVIDATPITTSTPIPDTTPLPAQTTTPETTKYEVTTQLELNTGTYIYAWTDPLYYGEAELTHKIDNIYNISITTVVGFSSNNGDLSFDFTQDENGFKILNDDPDYQQIKLMITENSLEIDYENNIFGGLNAEPKGMFYLKNANKTINDYLTRLYKAIELDSQYWNELTSTYTYTLEDRRLLLLIRTKSIKDSVALYDPKTKDITNLGELEKYDGDGLIEQLYKLFKEDLNAVYQVARKAEYDRLNEILIERRYNEEPYFIEDESFLLTSKEAFYIATGIPDSTGVTTSARDENNVGSVFVTEVDSVNDKVVLIQIYEGVRFEDGEGHSSTNDWLSVDRKTGKVSSTFYGPDNWVNPTYLLQQ